MKNSEWLSVFSADKQVYCFYCLFSELKLTHSVKPRYKSVGCYM